MLCVWMTALAGGMLVLAQSAASAHSVPLYRPLTWLQPVRHQGVPELAFSLVRLVGLGLGSWLAITTAADLVCQLLRLERLGTVVRGLTLPVVPRLVAMALGASLSMPSMLSMVAASVSAPSVSAHRTSGVRVVTVLPSWYGRGARAPGTSGGNVPELAVQPGAAAPVVTAPDRPAPGLSAPDRSAAGTAAPGRTAEAMWTVTRGESFWSISQAYLATSTGREPTVEETASYWTRLVTANRSRLVDPSNPDLIFSGQVLVLPSR